MKKFALKTTAVLLALAPLALADAATDTATPAPAAANCCTKDGSCTSPCTKDDKGIRCGSQEWLDIETVTIEAANGDPIAQYTVAYLTETDGEPTDADKEKAREWYAKSVPGLEKAAAEGHPYACLALAHMYAHGKGVTKNPEKAAEYMKMYKELCRKDATCPAENKCCPGTQAPADN